MKKGEKGILVAIVVIVVAFALINSYRKAQEEGEDRGIPFYTTAPKELQLAGGRLYSDLQCHNCHALWGTRNPMQSVPSPSMDGIGSLKDESWLYQYLSAEDPQSILPSRLKAEYKMPSFAHLEEKDRRTLAAYLASLKVQDWYLDETKKAEYEKLTGKDYKADGAD